MNDPISLLAAELPRAVRWGGALARQLRRHDIALGGKTSGSTDTDALTLADLSVQELLVAALRDMGPTVRRCRIEAERMTARGRPERCWTRYRLLPPIDNGTIVEFSSAGFWAARPSGRARSAPPASRASWATTPRGVFSR